jgi:uncharacterized pyridoxamine 5'-phosphate oxidase family protein
MWYADETGFYFHSGASKATCKQLKENPKLEVCFYAPSTPPDPGTMLRVSGEAEFLNDLDLKTRLLEERPFLRALGVTGPDDPNLAVFRIGTGEAYFWTMANNLRESEADRIEF